ncbi:MAG TPA: YeiH family protein [Thermoanaerobaculia bacterium]
MGLDMAQDRPPARASRLHLPENLILLVPGFLVSVVVAVAARFLSDHYGAPAMLMALLLGIAFHFLAEEGRCVPGIAVSAKGVLRFGVALLGIRVSVELLASLGFGVICLVVAGVVLTILFGMLGARLLRRGWRFALLTGGAVAICGASAAMAIAAVLPKNEHSERNLIFTVLGVTVLSTIAMIVYPVITSVAGLGPLATGVFLGGTIHDVAQVVGAGFSISDETGETATLVKLFRVTLLAPVVLCFSLAIRARSGAEDAGNPRPPLVPGFVLAFLALATVNSIGLVPAVIRNFVSDLSRWALLVAIAAVGMKTSLRTILDVGGQAIVLIVAETTFLAIFILAGLHLLN